MNLLPTNSRITTFPMATLLWWILSLSLSPLFMVAAAFTTTATTATTRTRNSSTITSSKSSSSLAHEAASATANPTRDAFLVPSPSSATTPTVARRSKRPRSRRTLALRSSAANGDGTSSSSAAAGTDNMSSSLPDDRSLEPGSHEELLYTLGVNLARQLGDVRPLIQNGQEMAAMASGLLDTVVGRLEAPAQTDLLNRRGQELNQLVQDRAANIQKQLEQAGQAMLETMKQEEGVEVLPTGVCVHVLEPGPEGPGQGVRPTQASTVKIHYHGTLADGTIFDSTFAPTGAAGGGGGDEGAAGKVGQPVQLPVAGVIPGWRDGVLKMHEGETAMIGIPSDQAYGPDGTPDGRIPGGATVFFKVQLVEVMSAGIGGTPSLLKADGTKLSSSSNEKSSGGLLGADGKPM